MPETLVERLIEPDAAALLELLAVLDGVDDDADEVVPPLHALAVNCAPFLPTPAYWAILSFTHWGVTGE